MQNPFGDAKPREAVIAERTGKDEKDVLAEAASEYQVKIRLTPEQFEQKKAKRTHIDALKAQLAEEDADTATVQVRSSLASCAAASLRSSLTMTQTAQWYWSAYLPVLLLHAVLLPHSSRAVVAFLTTPAVVHRFAFSTAVVRACWCRRPQPACRLTSRRRRPK